MKSSSSNFDRYHGVILAVIAIAAVVPGAAYCQTAGTVLLLQQTPPQGGTITPDIGVHHFEPYTQVTLTAVPKPGYQFVYWIGDVDEPAVNNTSVYLDTPKIVIAVFERSEYELLLVEERSSSAPRGGLRGRPADYARQGGSGVGGKRPRKWRPPKWEPPEREEPVSGDVPVPGEQEGDFPIPGAGDELPIPGPEVPEPATMILIALGALVAPKRYYESKA